jgi:uncharacterized membrane protein
MSTPNPYAAPKAPVADEAVVLAGNFDPNGRTRPAANGWTWIAEGWRSFMKSPGIWIAIVVVMLVVAIAANVVPYVGSLALMVLTPVFAGGVMLGCRALDEGRELEFRHLFAGFQTQTANLIVLGAIYVALMFAILVVVGAITGAGVFAIMSGGSAQSPAALGAGFFLFAIGMLVGLALSVPVAMLLWFAPALVVLNQVPPVEALKASWRGSLKNIVPFLIYGLVLLVLAIVASLPFMLGWLVLGPVMAASVYTSYRDIYFS